MFKKTKKEITPYINVNETIYTGTPVEVENRCDFCGNKNKEGFSAMSGINIKGIVINGQPLDITPFICKTCVKSLSTYCNK